MMGFDVCLGTEGSKQVEVRSSSWGSSTVVNEYGDGGQ